MAKDAAVIEKKKLSPRGVAVAAGIGTTIEFYDFFVYSTSVVIVLGPLFFPAADPLSSTLTAFATVGVGFFARPLGGIVFAHFGDRYGRKTTLIVSLLMMGIATVMVGLLPTFSQIGWWAPAILVGLRFVQGLAVGGEWGGAVLLAVEHAPTDKRAFYGSFPQFGAPLGLLGSSSVIALAQLLPKEQFLEWGWRVPFLLSAVLLLIGLYMRSRIDESDEFKEAKREEAPAKIPLLVVLRSFWPIVLIGTATTFIGHAGYILTSFLPSYSTRALNVSSQASVSSLIWAAGIAVVILFFLVKKADQFDRRRILMGCAIFLALWIWPAFLITQSLGDLGVILAVVIGYIALTIHYGLLSSLLAEQFPPAIRYTGVTLSYTLSALIGGGLLPLLTSSLVGSFGGSYMPAVVILVISCALTVVGAKFCKERPPVSASKTGMQREVQKEGMV